jgi:hypothetical protein
MVVVLEVEAVAKDLGFEPLWGHSMFLHMTPVLVDTSSEADQGSMKLLSYNHNLK